MGDKRKKIELAVVGCRLILYHSKFPKKGDFPEECQAIQESNTLIASSYRGFNNNLAAHTKYNMPHYEKEETDNPHEYWCLQEKLANFLEMTGDYGEALVWHLEVIETMEWDTAPLELRTIALNYRYHGREDLYDRVSETARIIMDRLLQGRPTVENNSIMALWFLDNDCYPMALRYCKCALQLSEQEEDTPYELFHLLGTIYLKMKRYTKALEWLKRSLGGTDIENPGSINVNRLQDLEQIGTIYLTTEPTEFGQAAYHLHFAALGYSAGYGQSSMKTLKVAFKLSCALHRNGDYEMEHTALSFIWRFHPAFFIWRFHLEWPFMGFFCYIWKPGA